MHWSNRLPPSSFQAFAWRVSSRAAFVCRIKRLNMPFFVAASLIHAAVTCSSHLEMTSLMVIDPLNPGELDGTDVTPANTLSGAWGCLALLKWLRAYFIFAKSIFNSRYFSIVRVQMRPKVSSSPAALLRRQGQLPASVQNSSTVSKGGSVCLPSQRMRGQNTDNSRQRPKPVHRVCANTFTSLTSLTTEARMWPRKF